MCVYVKPETFPPCDNFSAGGRGSACYCVGPGGPSGGDKRKSPRPGRRESPESRVVKKKNTPARRCGIPEIGRVSVYVYNRTAIREDFVDGREFQRIPRSGRSALCVIPFVFHSFYRFFFFLLKISRTPCRQNLPNRLK